MLLQRIFQGHVSPFGNFYPVHLEDAQGRVAECAEQLYVLRMAEECGASARIKKGIQEEKNPYVYIKELAKGIKKMDQWRRAHKGILAEVVELFVTYPTLMDNNFTLATFIDFRKAFDTVNHSILLSKAENMDIRRSSLEWLRSYLYG